MKKNLILYFDYWTVGIHNFKLFDSQLKEHGYETKLFHLNSWKGIESPEFQEIDGIKCYDIKYYKTNLIYKVLEIEKPIAVIMLNASFITDRSVFLACKKLKIKSVYLMHGTLTREEFIEESIQTINPKLKKNQLLRVIKYVQGTVPDYIYSLLKYNLKHLFRSHLYSLLIKTFRNPARYLSYPPSSFDLCPDLALVYADIDKAFYRKRFIDEKIRIEIVGNPSLDKYFNEVASLGENKEEFLKINNIPLNKPYVTYIEEAIAEDKLWDNEYRLSFFRTITDACVEAGLHLVIKLHPRTASGPYAESIMKLPNITVIAEVNFLKLIYFSKKCISHYSSALIYPILLNKPILVPRWGRSAELPNIYTEKEVTILQNIEVLKECLRSNQSSYYRPDYLKEYVSFTDGKTKERIVKYILDLVQ